MTELAEERPLVGALSLQKSALGVTHASTDEPDPTDNEGITQLMAGFTRTHRRLQRKAKPLTEPALTSVKATAPILPRHQGHAVRGENASEPSRWGPVGFSLVEVMRGALPR